MKRKLGEILIEHGAMTAADLAEVLDAQSGGDPSRVGELLVAFGKITGQQLARALAEQSGLQLVQLEQVSPQVAELVPMALQREHCLVPFKEDGPTKAVHVAVADPTTLDVLADLEIQVGRSLKISIAAREEIEAVHAALSGDVLQAEVVVEESNDAQVLGRVALKRIAVSGNGATPRGPPLAPPVPSFATDVPPLELPTRSRFPLAPVQGSYSPTVEMPQVPAPAALPARAQRPRPTTQPVAPPVLTPVEPPPPKPVEPARPNRRPITGSRPKVEPAQDEWAVRPAGAAIPRQSRPPSVPPPVAVPAPSLDPFATMPTEEVGSAPLTRALPPLSALDADPEVNEVLQAFDLPGAPAALPTARPNGPATLSVEIEQVQPLGEPMASAAPSRLALDATPELFEGAARPNRFPQPSAPRPDAVTAKRPLEPMPSPSPAELELAFAKTDLSLKRPPPVEPEPFAPTAPRPPAKSAPRPAPSSPRPPPSSPRKPVTTLESYPALARPPIEPLPSGRDVPLETLEAFPPTPRPSPVPVAEAVDAFSAAAPPPPPSPLASGRDRPVETRLAYEPRRHDVKTDPELPPSAPRPATPPAGVPALEAELFPLGDEPHPATPAQGESILTAPIELPPSGATPPEGIAVAEPEPELPLPALSPPTIALPEWMREASAPTLEVDDPLAGAVLAAGAGPALVRVLRLLVDRGLLTEAELLEELKKR